MLQLLNGIVKSMLEQHKGGEVFFNNLDKELLKHPILEVLIASIKEEHSKLDIIVSGKFGNFFHNYCSSERKASINKMIVVEGGLRKTNCLDLSYLEKYIKGRQFVFLDDSYYLGRTRDTIKTEIERLGGKLVHTYVIYDGAKMLDESVSNLYKYYN
jgi:hypothetical protein